jgi:hypothetical protein
LVDVFGGVVSPEQPTTKIRARATTIHFRAPFRTKEIIIILLSKCSGNYSILLYDRFSFST